MNTEMKKRTFLDENFLLKNETAKILYHQYAKGMPIIDYHCHLDPKAIAENKRFRNISEIWLGGDHYKWRAMRAFGVEEAYITGEKTAEEKFQKWAETLPYTIGNPLLHWSALELKQYFGVEEQLTGDNWEKIYDACNDVINDESFTTQNLITNSNVQWICTTDDPIDTLAYHQAIAKQDSFKVAVTPTFRPDKLLAINAPAFNEYVERLAEVVGFTIDTYEKLVKATTNRIDYFHENGCFISDHAFTYVPYREASKEELEVIFVKGLREQQLSTVEIDQYITALMMEMGKKYAKLDWTMQLHIGAIRNANSRMYKTIGLDTGYDSIGDWNYVENLVQLLDALDITDELPKTIIYNLNAVHNDALSTLCGSFQEGGIKGKVQFGTGWWFNDQKDGMIKQMTSLAHLGLLSPFVGMLTDSRSFLSYPRHEYFRRILCNLIGTWVEDGEAPNDIELLGKIVQDICYNNAYNYFKLGDRK